MSRFALLLLPLFVAGQNLQPIAETVSVLHTETVDHGMQAIRNARGRAFNRPGHKLPLEPGSALTPLVSTIIDRIPLPELPMSDGSVIVYGEVTASDVFVSENKNALYTEYTFRVERMVKPCNELAPESTIAIVTLGGAGRRADGAVVRYNVQGYAPRLVVGAWYLMFLTHLPAPADAYPVVKFWNVKAGILSAAFDEDIGRAKEFRSAIEGATIQQVIQMMEEQNPQP